MRFLLFILIGVGAVSACSENKDNKTPTSYKSEIELPISETRNSDSIEVIMKDSKTGKETRQKVSKDILKNPSTIQQPEQPIIEK